MGPDEARTAADRQLLDAMGIAPEHHAEIIAKRDENTRLRAADAAAVVRNATAMASVFGRVLDLPEGLGFEYR